MARRTVLMKSTPYCLLGIVALSGCDSDVVLDGNFEQWPSPIHSGLLPGDPSHDQIIQTPNGQYAAAMVFNDRLLFGDAACQIGPNSCPSPSRWAYFTAGPLTPDQQSNPFTWALDGQAYIQPGCDLLISMFHGHFEDVATLRFQREGSADATVTLTDGGGSQVIDTLAMGDPFTYALRVDPATSEIDMLGTANVGNLETISDPGADARGFFFAYLNDNATGCGIYLDEVLGYAES